MVIDSINHEGTALAASKLDLPTLLCKITLDMDKVNICKMFLDIKSRFRDRFRK
jgi:hypothetical protein